MEIVSVLKEAVEVSKKNPIIFVPIIAMSVVVTFLTLLLLGGGMLSMGVTGGFSPDALPTAFGAFAGLAFFVGIVSGILWLFVHGMTVGMAQEAVETGSTNVGDGLAVARDRFFHLLGGAILVGLVVMIGFMLLIIPGVIAAFLLMFTFVAIVVEDLGPVQGMKRSYEVVKSHVGDVLILFVVMLVIGFLVGIVSAIFGFIPILGQAIQALFSGVFGGYVSVVMVLVYKGISQPESPAQA